jgi:hypothetical protein
MLMNYLYNILFSNKYSLFYDNSQYVDDRKYDEDEEYDEDDKEYDRDEVNQYWNRLDILDIYL